MAPARRLGDWAGPAPSVIESPQSADYGFVLGQDRHGRVVAVQALAGEHVTADQFNQRRQARGAGADPVRQEPALANAGVDTSSSMPSRANDSLCRLSGWCSPNLA